MENASKALIIAGAILLAIVIISLGLVVVNNTKETIQNANMSEQEIQAFNSKFTSYEGPKVTGTNVNTLIAAIVASNQAQLKAGTNSLVDINASKATSYDGTTKGSDTCLVKTGETVTGMTTTIFKASTLKTYKVTLSYNAGLVSKAEIEDA